MLLLLLTDCNLLKRDYLLLSEILLKQACIIGELRLEGISGDCLAQSRINYIRLLRALSSQVSEVRVTNPHVTMDTCD